MSRVSEASTTLTDTEIQRVGHHFFILEANLLPYTKSPIYSEHLDEFNDNLAQRSDPSLTTSPQLLYARRISHLISLILTSSLAFSS